MYALKFAYLILIKKLLISLILILSCKLLTFDVNEFVELSLEVGEKGRNYLKAKSPSV